jgi:hypothetical protein
MSTDRAPESLAALLRWIDKQIARCHRKASQARFFTLLLKSIQISLAGSLPILALAAPSASKPAITGIIGACIVIIEGFQSSFKFDQFWVTYRRSGSELQGEKQLYEMKAGPYEGTGNPDALLAVRVTELTHQRYERWERNLQRALANRNE